MTIKPSARAGLALTGVRRYGAFEPGQSRSPRRAALLGRTRARDKLRRTRASWRAGLAPRKRGGERGSAFTSRKRSTSGWLLAHLGLPEREEKSPVVRCSRSRSRASVASRRSARRNARKASLMPPRSAMSARAVSSPLTFTPGYEVQPGVKVNEELTLERHRRPRRHQARLSGVPSAAPGGDRCA